MPSAATSDVATRKTFDLCTGEPKRKHPAVRREDVRRVVEAGADPTGYCMGG
jgi:hypothetical protein